MMNDKIKLEQLHDLYSKKCPPNQHNEETGIWPSHNYTSKCVKARNIITAINNMSDTHNKQCVEVPKHFLCNMLHNAIVHNIDKATQILEE